MTASVRIGYLGVAHGHGRTYAERFAADAGVRLTRVWDRDRSRAETFAQRFSMTPAPAPDDVIRDADAVVVASETAFHADLCLEAIAAGRAVLCQKPLALTLEECDRIVAAVAARGTYFETAFQMRYDPANRRLRDLVHGGAVGTLGWLRRRHCIGVLFHSDFITGESRWHADPALNRGLFFDDAVHAADFLRWLCGEPVSVMAEVGSRLAPVEDTGLCIYRFGDGVLAELANSATTLAGENTCEVYGDQGVILQNHDDLVSATLRPPGAAALRLFRRDRPELGFQDQGVPLPAHHGERIAAVAPGFLAALRAGVPTATAWDGRQAVAMILGAYASAAQGRRVAL